jgi:hypothetical protein
LTLASADIGFVEGIRSFLAQTQDERLAMLVADALKDFTDDARLRIASGKGRRRA